MFDCRLQKTVLGSKREGVPEGQGRLHNEELRNYIICLMLLIKLNQRGLIGRGVQ
jgi:hypothetical protein